MTIYREMIMTGAILTLIALSDAESAHAQSWSVNGTSLYYNGGKVGIGTSSPANQLHLSASAEKLLRMSRTGQGTWDLGILTGNHLGIFRDGGGNAYMVVSSSGNVGVGTTSPARKLHVFGSAEEIITLSNSTTGAGSWHIGVLNNDSFLIKEDGESEPYFTIAGNGDVKVNGKMNAEEIAVIANVVPDYVFQEDYELRTIDELKRYIEEKGHLPGIPSAEQVAEEGLRVGHMQLAMLEKIEELSLYIIDLHEEIQALKDTQNTERSDKGK